MTENNLGELIAALERPDGILEDHASKLLAGIAAATPITAERERLAALCEAHADARELKGRTEALISFFDVLRRTEGAPGVDEDDYRLLLERMEWLYPTSDDAEDGHVMATWRAAFNAFVEVTGDVKTERGYYMVASIYSSLSTDYAEAREHWGHNLETLRCIEELRSQLNIS